MKKGVLLLIILIAFGSNVALAQLPVPSAGGGTTVPSSGGGSTQSNGIPTLGNPLRADSFEELLFDFVDILIFVGVILATLMFVFIGFKFVMAQGNEQALKDARSWFFAAVIGTAILISSKVIVEVVKNTFISAGIVDKELFNKP